MYFLVGDECLMALGVLFFIREIYKLILILVPIGLILMLAFDFFMLMANPDSGDKKVSMSIKRIVYTIVVFLVPAIVYVVFSALSISAFSDSDSCFAYVGSKNVEEVRSIIQQKQNELDEKNDNLTQAVKDSAKNSINSIKILKYSINTGGYNNSSNKSDKEKADDKDASVMGKKYNISNDKLKALAKLCENEQGTVKGAAAEASLMANLYELKGQKYSSLPQYVEKGNWWGSNYKRAYSSRNSVNKKILARVKDVLVNGNRTLPLYIDEHDCWLCNPKKCKQGYKGDICTVNGKSGSSYIKNRSNYTKNETIIQTIYSDNKYTFYSFPDKTSDPFGYTSYAYKKYKKLNK